MSVNFSSFQETAKISLSKFAFTDPDNWQKELLLLNKRNPEIDRLIYPDSMLISSILDQIINCIISSFIKVWYKSINQSKTAPDDLFVDEVKISIQYAMASIYLKLRTIDLANVLVLRLVPIITNHFNNFVTAKTLIRKKYLLNNTNNSGGANTALGKTTQSKNFSKKLVDDKLLNLTDEKQVNLLISKFYNHGKLHPSVNSFRENVQFSSYTQKSHLRNKLNKILPMILNKNESNCLPVNLLIREIIINCVFLPIVNMVVAPDFWNQMIVDKVGNTLKDRTKVIQLRAALQKHSKQASSNNKKKQRKNVNPESSTKSTKSTPARTYSDNKLFEFKLTLNTTQSGFEKYLKKINKSNSIVDLRQLKFYTNLQLQKTLRNDEYKKIVKEFNDLNKNSDHDKSANKKRVKDIHERYKIIIKRLQIIQLTLTNRINNLNFENQTNGLDNSSINSANTSASSIRNHNKLCPDSINLSLETILNDSSLLTYYMEYMDQNDKTIILQFWLVVNGIKNPLEDSNLINTDDIYAEDTLKEIHVDDAEINHNLNFANDIKSIFTNYFNSKLIIENNKVVYDNVEVFVKTYDKYKIYLENLRKFKASENVENVDKKDEELYSDYTLYDKKYELNKYFIRARKSILILQANAFKRMKDDLENFKNSNIYLKLIAAENNRLSELNETPLDSNFGNKNFERNSKNVKNHSNNINSGLGVKYEESSGDPLALYSGNDEDYNDTTLKNKFLDFNDGGFSDDDLNNGMSNSVSSLKSGAGNKGKKIFDDNDDLVVSYDVLNAVEHALNEIIENNDYKTSDATKLKSDILSNNFKDNDVEDVEANSKSSNKIFDAYKDIFGQSSSLFKGDFKNSETHNESKKGDSSVKSSNGSSNTIINDNPGNNLFFDTDQEISEIDDMDSVISEMINSETIGEYAGSSSGNTEIHLAAPGDLDLAEEIEKLSNDIENLNNQVQILQPLLKKAELTNNTAELRILRKANISLQRELQLKELQRQQYIVQENDNSLFGKSRVSIQSYITSNDEETGKEYTSYIIEVQKFNYNEEDEQNVSAGWIVARRFSQFYMLNKYLKSVYPKVKVLNFPKKNLMFLNQAQQKILIENRKILLEEYLKELLKLPEVCKSRIFRLFLSSQNFNNDILNKKKSFDKINERKSSTFDSLPSSDSIKNLANKYTAIEDVTAKLYNGITNGIEYLNGSLVFSNSQNAGLSNGLSTNFDEDSNNKSKNKLKNNNSNFQETEFLNELNSYDDDKTTFVKPICDLFLSIFALNRNNSWLRGRAILVILQQLLGSTIEKKIREYVSIFNSENKVIDLLNLFKDKIWPNNIFFLNNRGENNKEKTEIEKLDTKNESRTLLEIIITDISSKIVGLNNSKFAAAEIHNMLQNDILNTHLIYCLIDELIDSIFPEIVGSDDIDNDSVNENSK